MIVTKGTRFLASWWFTALLFLSLVASYLYFSFGRNPYPAWTAFVFHAPIGVGLYAGVILNLIAASVRIVHTRLTRLPISSKSIQDMDIHAGIAIPDDRALERTIAWLKNRLSSRDVRDHGIHSLRGRFSFLPGTLFRLGLAILLTSLLASVHVRRTYDTVLHEGERKEVLSSTISLVTIMPDLPEDFLRIGEDSAFVLDGVSAALSSSGKTFEITPGFPARINGLYYRIVHLGLSQPLSVRMSGRQVEKTADLDILPPGKTDIVSLPTEEAFLTFTLEPGKTITKGLLKGKQFNLAHPVYRIVLQKGKIREKAEGKIIKPGEQARIGSAALSLGTNSRFVRIQIVSDPALPWIYAGVAITLAGMLFMISRFFWYERELAAMMQGRTLLIGCREEFFKKWGIHKFQRWKEELSVLNLP